MRRIRPTRPGPGRVCRVLPSLVAGTLLAALARPSVAQAATTYLNDNFTRTVTDGWGTANTGQTWKVSSASESFVGNGYGTIVTSPDEKNSATVTGPWKDVVVTALVAVDKVPAHEGEEVTQGFWIRKQPGLLTGFFEELVCRQGQSAHLQTQYMGSSGKVMESDVLASYGACQKNTWYWIEFKVVSVSSSKTQISLKTWQNGKSEPGWQDTADDTHSDVQVEGDIQFEGSANGVRQSEGSFGHRLNKVTVTSA